MKTATEFPTDPHRNVEADAAGAYTVENFASGNGRNRCAGIFLGAECVENFHERDHGPQYFQRAKARAKNLNKDVLLRAREFAAELRANVDAWYAQPNTSEKYAAFTARNGATWRRAHEDGTTVKAEVMRILRERN
jgi:hypothetical protein